jgi:hypothetical protein
MLAGGGVSNRDNASFAKQEAMDSKEWAQIHGNIKPHSPHFAQRLLISD